MKTLIDAGANANMKNVDGFTPLHLAAGLGRENIVEFLVQNGSDVNAKTNAGQSPHHIATQSGNCFYSTTFFIFTN